MIVSRFGRSLFERFLFHGGLDDNFGLFWRGGMVGGLENLKIFGTIPVDGDTLTTEFPGEEIGGLNVFD